MPKATVQSLILERLTRIEEKMDSIIPQVEQLKTKAAIAGGVAGIIGTAVVTLVLSAFRFFH